MTDRLAGPVVRLLGPPGLAGGAVAPGFPERGFLLLAMVATAPVARVSRAEAASRLWPDAPAATARANLRQLVLRMNRVLPRDPSLILSEGEMLRIGTPGDVDVSEVLRLLEAPSPEARLAAIDLCHGPLLAGPPDADVVPDWLRRARQGLTARVLRAALDTLDEMTRFGAGTAPEIARIGDRLAWLDPDEGGEPLRIAVATAFARIGEYDRARTTLAGPGGRPSTATDAVARRLAAARARLPNPAPALPLRGVTTVPRLALLRPRVGAGGGAGAAPYLAERLVEELAFGLASYRSFAVLAPYSTFPMADEFGLPRDNSLMRADYAVSGILDAEDDGMTLRLRLTHLDSRAIIWVGAFPVAAEVFGRALRQLTARMVMTLAAELERKVRDDLRMTAAPSALLHFLQGRTMQSRCDLPHVRRARSEFSRALAVDAGFAPAHARIAETLFVEWILCGGTDAELLAAARLRADQAVHLEPAGPTGHWVGGAVALYQRRWDRVEEAFGEAESLAPHDADMLLEFGDALSHLGRHDAAEARFRAALDLNPVPPDRYWWFGASIAFNRLDFATAALRCDRIGDKAVALGLRTASYAQDGQIERARKWARRLKEALPGVTAEDLIRLSPDRDGEANNRAYVEGLRRAGVK